MGQEPPEGWRRGARWFGDDAGNFGRGTDFLYVLYTNAPERMSPYADGYEHVFIKYAAVTQTREVGEWTDAA